MEHNGYRILEIDPWLQSHAGDIDLRMQNLQRTRDSLLSSGQSLSDYANGHLYFGFHRTARGWYYREWAPAAQELSLIGDFNDWNRTSHHLSLLPGGVWELFLPGVDALAHGSRVKVQIRTGSHTFDRIPLYCRRVVQDEKTMDFSGQVWWPEIPYQWKKARFSQKKSEPLMIYECHVGMAGEEPKVSTFREFTRNVLPRIHKLGYNAIQLMAVMEHPYYGSFGYQVSNFFAVSSRFGTPEDLKELVDAAHLLGIAVLLDLVHSHAARNALEGLAQFDGTEFQFFHAGAKGDHPAWGTRLFNYGKPEVLHFLLSNLKYWMQEYRLDGLRFDGVTSMLYHDHGLGGVFNHYKKYFSPNTDTEAVTYLQLAAQLCKELNPNSILIAEDMSGMPGMCLPVEDGGIGFDYRLGMGVPDFWIRTLREKRDEDWNMGQIWHELRQRRPQEKVVGYCESHDQAMVGDKTIMFWLADAEMYWHMQQGDQNPVIDRAIALHEMIRLVTCLCGGEGYLNFMGNEFGHPEWIDFPREGNGWSYHYARRRWSLADDESLRYRYLQAFDQAMIHLVRQQDLLREPAELILLDEAHKLLCFRKKRHLFLFNFHPTQDGTVRIPLSRRGKYQAVLSTSWEEFGGWAGHDEAPLEVQGTPGNLYLELLLCKRTALVLAPSATRTVKKD